MLVDVDVRLHRIVCWRVTLPAYIVFHVIDFPYMVHYAISGVHLRSINDIFVFQSRVHSVGFFSFRVGIVSSRPVASAWAPSAAGAFVPQSKNTVVRILPSSNVTVIGETSNTRICSVLEDSSWLFDSVAKVLYDRCCHQL